MSGDASCVTVTVTGDSPLAVTVIVATREVASGLTEYDAVIDPLPEEEDGLTLHQLALLLVDQDVLDVTVKIAVPAGE